MKNENLEEFKEIIEAEAEKRGIRFFLAAEEMEELKQEYPVMVVAFRPEGIEVNGFATLAKVIAEQPEILLLVSMLARKKAEEAGEAGKIH